MHGERGRLCGKGRRRGVFARGIRPCCSLHYVPRVLKPICSRLLGTRGMLVGRVGSTYSGPVISPSARGICRNNGFRKSCISFRVSGLGVTIAGLTVLTRQRVGCLFRSHVGNVLPPFIGVKILKLGCNLRTSRFATASAATRYRALSGPVCMRDVPGGGSGRSVMDVKAGSTLLTGAIVRGTCRIVTVLVVNVMRTMSYLRVTNQLDPQSRRMCGRVQTFFPIFQRSAPGCGRVREVVMCLGGKELRRG